MLLSVVTVNLNRRAGLEGKDLAAAEEHPVQEGQDASAGVGVINRRAEDKAVGLSGLGDKGVHPVVGKNAAVVRAAAAADAVAHRAAADLEDLILDPFPLQLPADLLQRKAGVASGFWTAV